MIRHSRLTGMMTATIAAAMIWGGGLSRAAAGAEADEALRSAVEGDTVTIRAGDRELLVYRSTPNPYKVYVQAWSTPAGRQVLRDSPHDHVHHHALMYAIGVNGVDFWGEGPEDRPGTQVPVGEPVVTIRAAGPKQVATIRQEIQWKDGGGQVHLEETRRVTLHHGAVPEASLLSWDAEFRVPAGKPQAELWGRHYFGLGLRMITALDQGGRVRTAGEEGGEPVRGTEQLTRGAWCAYTAALDGQPLTVAMFDHPANRRPATWFSMTAPFAYLAATLNLHREPLTVASGAPLRLRYGVALWDGNPSAAELTTAGTAWQKAVDQAP